MQNETYQLESVRWSTGRNVLAFAALLSVVACIAGYLLEPARFFRSYTVAFTFTAAIGLGAFFFTMVQYLSGSAWSVVIRRIMENIMVTLPVGALLFAPLAFGLKDVYPWTNHELMAHDHVLKLKAGFLHEDFFMIRTLIYFAVWSIWIYSIYRQSTKMDTERSAKQMHIMSRWSAPGLFLAVVVGSIASFDWLMSIQPKWYSTIFGLYYLAGGALAFWSVVTLVCLGFRKAGILKDVIREEHYHDLGKWLFAMTAFYTYIAFSQYMLIWYANLPEETIFYRDRAQGGWLYVSLALPIIRFFIPFFTLLARPAKRNLKVIGLMAAWSLVCEYIDLYWIVMPVHYATGPRLHWLDFATLAATISICAYVFWGRCKRNKLVPVGDLRLEQSLHFENA